MYRLYATLIAALVLAGACSKSDSYVQFVNGFDFPVSVTLTSKSGDTSKIKLPARGRIGKDLDGPYKVKVMSTGGASLSEENVDFGKRAKRKKKCLFFYNALGSAAIVKEDIAYGIGIKSRSKTTAGGTRVKFCYTWGFETKEPPKAIRVKKYTAGRNHSWMHYDGDGSWHTSLTSLLNNTSWPGRARARAQKIIRAVITHDPDNKKLPEMKKLFAQHNLFVPPPLTEAIYQKELKAQSKFRRHIRRRAAARKRRRRRSGK
jgi:hypothetical protein